MRTNELIKKINDLGFDTDVNQLPGITYIDVGMIGCDICGLSSKTASWFDVETYQLDFSVAEEKIAALSQVISKYLATPLDEREPEKKYYLKFLYNGPLTGDRYVKRVMYTGNSFTFELSDNPVEFSGNVLAEIKQSYSSIAPAIDAMKEEVKSDD